MSAREGEPEVSVIVPYRNAQQHLDGLLDSIRRQADDVAFEVIMVDNGSSDGSGAIAERYARQMPMVLAQAPDMANASYAPIMSLLVPDFTRAVMRQLS